MDAMGREGHTDLASGLGTVGRGKGSPPSQVSEGPEADLRNEGGFPNPVPPPVGKSL